jgi:hypothetical protein
MQKIPIIGAAADNVRRQFVEYKNSRKPPNVISCARPDFLPAVGSRMAPRRFAEYMPYSIPSSQKNQGSLHIPN